MWRIANAFIAAAVVAAAAWALPGDLVVVSDREVTPDEAAGLYYLGSCSAGYLYNGSSAAVGRAAPYRVLDRDAQLKDYYIVWAPGWVGLTPQAFEHLGAAVRLSEYEILVGLERGPGPGALRAVEHRIELIKLEPVTPVDWRYDGEAPPKKKDLRVEAAINTITKEEYAGYIRQLQDFRTRCSETEGCDRARDWLRNFLSLQYLDASLFEFECVGFDGGYYPEPRKNIYVETDHGALLRSRDLGKAWRPLRIAGVGYVGGLSWLNSDVGFAVGSENVLAKTVDGGETWETIKIRPGEPEKEYHPFALYFVDGKTGWLGGSFRKTSLFWMTPMKSFLMKTIDGGRTWRRQAVPQDLYPRVINFFDGRHGWVSEGFGLGRPARILYTNDGGATWRECTRPATTTDVLDFAAVGPTDAWAAGRSRGLLHTADGLTWNYVFPGVGQTFNEVEFPDASHGYAAGPTLIATDDGGETWRDVEFKTAELFYTVLSFADKDHGVIGDYGGEFLFRTDNGCKDFINIKRGIDLSAENVVAERRGYERPEEIVIIGGHYDSVSVDSFWLAPGAEDNASGTACALAAARAFRNMSFKRTVRYIAFGDEEFGLTGSRAYAKHCADEGQKIVAVLNADMVSYDEEGGSRDDLTVGAPGDAAWLVAYLQAAGGLYGQKLIYDWDGEWVSDDRSFSNAGYAALGVIEGEVGVGGGIDYPWYHTTEDTLDKLQPAFGARCARDLAATLAHLAGVGDHMFEPEPPATGAVPFARPFAVYPNPYCYATSAGGINFVGVRSPATVEIYDLAGRRVGREEVAAGCDECVWRPARPGGEALAPGVYLYRLEGQEQKKAGKVVVAK